MPAEAELVLFRISQEALRNVKKHSKAAHATVRIEFGKKKTKLSVTDDGGGFRVPKPLSTLARGGKLGLMGMEERTRLLGGNLSIESELGKGTKIEVEVPV